MIKPGEESDYFLLHTIISLVGFAVGSEDLSPKERVMKINTMYSSSQSSFVFPLTMGLKHRASI